MRVARRLAGREPHRAQVLGGRERARLLGVDLDARDLSLQRGRKLREGNQGRDKPNRYMTNNQTISRPVFARRVMRQLSPQKLVEFFVL